MNACEWLWIYLIASIYDIFTYILLIFREYTIHGCYGYVNALCLKTACWGSSDNKHHFRYWILAVKHIYIQYIYIYIKYVQKPANVAVVDHDAQRIYHQVLEIPKMKMQCLPRLVWRWTNPSTAYIAWKQHQLGPPANSQTLNTKNHVKNKVSHWILVRIL